MTRILLNHVYYQPVGHVIEAIQYAKGLHDANPGSEVHLALSDGAPWELCEGAPWIADVYRVPLRDPRRCDLSIPEMPREWDYVVDNNLMRYEDEQVDAQIAAGDRLPGHEPERGWEEKATIAHYDRTEAELVVRRGRGVLFPRMTLPAGLAYGPDHLRLEIPAGARAYAGRYAHDGPKIAVLPAGSGAAALYPEPRSWIAILDALRTKFSGVRFYLTGARTNARHPDLTTTSHNQDGVARILASGEDVIDCFDIGLWNQAALLERCDLLLSPHSGFGFLGLCVGTPWLTISGGNWGENFVNGVPFYSVLPDNPDYPLQGAIPYGYDGPTIPDMQHDALLARIGDLLDGASFLLDPATTYQDAGRRHRENIARANIEHRRMPAGWTG